MTKVWPAGWIKFWLARDQILTGQRLLCCFFKQVTQVFAETIQ